jgi:hypothetical protein
MHRLWMALLLLGAAPQDGLQLQEESDAFGGRRTALTFNRRPAFVILPKGDAPAAPRDWVWYAPTFRNQYPNARHTFLLERALKAGMGVAGIDVGESYGSPEGTRLFEGFHEAIVGKFKLSPKAVLLPQSRGGLMLYNWATLHPDQVARIAGIYTVCDLLSWPGLDRSCGAYRMTADQLAKELPRCNPIELLAPLAKAKVPICTSTATRTRSFRWRKTPASSRAATRRSADGWSSWSSRARATRRSTSSSRPSGSRPSSRQGSSKGGHRATGSTPSSIPGLR